MSRRKRIYNAIDSVEELNKRELSNETHEIIDIDEIQKENKYNVLSIFSLVLSILSIMSLFFDVSLNIVVTLFIITVLVSLLGIFQCKISDQKGMYFSIVSLSIIGIILIYIMINTYFTFKSLNEEEMNIKVKCSVAKECIDNNDGNSTCKYLSNNSIICPNKYLSKNQYKLK